MKKEEKEQKEKDRNQEDRFSSVDSGEYDFFITENSKFIEKSSTKFQTIAREKTEYATDQSKTFFLPDFFPTKISSADVGNTF